MTEQFGSLIEVHSLLYKFCFEGMPQIMKPEIINASFLDGFLFLPSNVPSVMPTTAEACKFLKQKPLGHEEEIKPEKHHETVHDCIDCD